MLYYIFVVFATSTIILDQYSLSLMGVIFKALFCSIAVVAAGIILIQTWEEYCDKIKRKEEQESQLIGWYIKGLRNKDNPKWDYTDDKKEYEFALLLGLAIDPVYTYTKLPPGYKIELLDPEKCQHKYINVTTIESQRELFRCFKCGRFTHGPRSTFHGEELVITVQDRIDQGEIPDPNTKNSI